MQERTPQNKDELRVFGLISFVAILVGAAIAVFDAGLWLKDDSTQTNAITYMMGVSETLTGHTRKTRKRSERYGLVVQNPIR